MYMVKNWFFLPLLAVVLSCSKKKSGPESPAPASAFFTSEKAWCTVEFEGKSTDGPVDRFEEIFVFDSDGKLTVMSYDLDDERRIQWNARGQPRVKSIEEARFRVEGANIVFVADVERQSPFEKIKRKLDGKEPQCFRLHAGESTSVHCPCALPEEK
jgi:hypothetical protein